MKNITMKCVAVFVATLVWWLIGGSTLYQHLSARANATQLQELSQRLAERAEKALDYVVTAQADLLVVGHASCSPEAIRELRKMVLTTGTVSEVYMITPEGSCSTFDELSMPLPNAYERMAWTPGRNPKFRVGAIEGDGHTALGVSWGLGTQLELVMAISAESLLFDVMPTALREHGHIELFVGDGERLIFRSHRTTVDLDPGHENTELFLAAGARYPGSAEIAVDRTALAAWRAQPPRAVVVGRVLYGVIFAAVIGRAVVRMDNPELASLSKALKEREIVPYFQPIIDLENGAVIGCEALARWIKPNGDRVSPAQFIPLVEQHGLADELLEAMISGTARRLGARLREHPDFRVSFNVTPDQFVKPGFAERLKFLADQYNLQTGQICIEVTERQAMTAPDEAKRVTEELAKLGVRVAIDDAGTGHNGLASMQQLNAGSLKIDKFFVDQVHADPRSRVMIEMFVSVSQKYGMETVAEGIETEEQAQALRAAGVDAAQGYFFSKPVPPEEMIGLMRWEFEIAILKETLAKDEDKFAA
ncbi:MAG: EAL domain-containing protein [Neomegalonema sp.]